MTDRYVLRRTIGSWSSGTPVSIGDFLKDDPIHGPAMEGKVIAIVGSDYTDPTKQFVVDKSDLVKRRSKKPKPKKEETLAV